MIGSSQLLIALIHSLTLGLSLMWVYSYSVPLMRRYSKRTQTVLQGLMFGVFAILGMLTADTLVGGFRIDGRNAMIGISGVFGGPISAVVTTVIVSLFRLSLGGEGTLSAVFASATTAILGIIFHVRYRHLPASEQISRLLILGLAIGVQVIFWIALLEGQVGVDLALTTAPALLIFYPLGTMLIGTLFLHHQRNQQARQALEQERSLLRTLIDQLPDYIFVKDAALRFIASNTAHARAVNSSHADDMIGKSAAQLFPPELAENFEADDRRILETGEALINAERITTDSAGNKRWVLTTKMPFRDPGGRIAGLVGISRDITARKQAEEALRTSEEQFRSAFDYAAIGMALVGLDGRWLKVNDALCRIVGYSEAELLPKTFQDITHPDDLDADLGFVRQVLAGEIKTYQMEKRYFHKLGYVVWVLLSVSLVRETDGQPLHFIAQIQDITLRKKVEDALMEERNLLRALIDHMPDYVFIKDTQCRFIIVNHAVLASGNLTTSEEMVGKTDFDYFPHDIAQTFYDDDRRVIETGQALVNKEEISIDRSTGQENWHLITKIPLRDTDGTITGLLGISRNITERKKAEKQALELAVQKENMQLLADFIRDASHDLKTPLTVIQSSLYLLQRSPDPERRQQHAANIEQQVTRLAQLIDDQLMTVKLDSSAEFSFESVDLNRVVREVTTSLSRLAENHKLALIEELGTAMPRIQADEEKLMRALRNLVENAIAYTAAGGTVTVRTFAEEQHVVFEVRDTGIGISEGDLPHIFERFFRVDKARSTQTGGSGLGLPIARKIIEAHGGHIEVESVVGVGSTFRVCLDLRSGSGVV